MKTLSRTDLDGTECSVVFSDDEVYRYDLCWRWQPGPLLIGWLLNPSTATHEVLDPTVRGMIARARGWDYAGLRIVNLFGLRATDPKDMKAHVDPIGDDNDLILRRMLNQAAEDGSIVIAGWGAHGRHMDRQDRALQLAKAAGVELHAFRVNSNGTPKHPLYVALNLLPKLWSPAP